MKTFVGNKPLNVIKQQCDRAGLSFNDHMFRTQGWDTIRIDCPSGAHVIYNTFNGKFFGKTDKGVEFDSSSTKHESKLWFQALLAFFYQE